MKNAGQAGGMVFLKQTFIYLFIILSMALTITAQTPRSTEELAASLEKQSTTAVGKEKIVLQNRLASLFFRTQPKRAIIYARRAFTLAEELKDENGKARALIFLANAYRNRGDIQKPFAYAREALQIFRQSADNAGIIDALNTMGTLYSSIDNYDEALKYLLEAQLLAENSGLYAKESGILYQLCNLYINLGNPQKALEYSRTAYDLAQKSKMRRPAAYYRNSMGLAYNGLKQYKQALEIFRESFDLFTELNDTYGLTAAAGNLGDVYEHMNNSSKALEYMEKAVGLAEENGYKDFLCENLSNIGDHYLRLEDFPRAESYYKNALSIAGKIDNKNTESEIYKQLAGLYTARKDHKTAMEYYKKHVEIKDRMVNEAKNHQLLELQERYNAEKRTREIDALKHNNRIQTITRNAFLAGFILVLVILALVFKKYLYFFSFWKKQKYIGQYRLIETVGSGGMSTVYKAHTIRDKTKLAAVKVLKDEFFNRESTRKRFKQEGTIIDKLHHPNIIKIFERGETHDKLYIAMEFLEGRTMAEKIENEGAFSLDACLPVMKQITGALAFIHRADIVHRDLKPENIMITGENGNEIDEVTVKLLDFGLSRMKLQSRITMTGVLVGTAGYMAPEQIAELTSSPAGDIFSLGLVFYEMVTGRPAFTGDSFSQIEKQILETEPAVPIDIRSRIPGKLHDLIMQMLSKNPHHRPTAETVLERLDELATHRSSNSFTGLTSRP
jgi:tetratricopeptide (TPR) repeat protein/tRNA A-37 threonylcarbamoyl transferase component Bud32